ncbi:hypothetical protein ACM46_22585 [Chryseobacterium angstadtii]|uniref:Lipoprotein n=1 Tax=Chryseobacterium angstadtii TaxID=558151 RepID=A0A0J7HXM0_9FLAO|nr:hypothetical protein [Chryseobacterium angstadtii]KMQ58489.1 hypothetical protein ACM46_22585 [Chryseobacterium angstadtii]
MNRTGVFILIVLSSCSKKEAAETKSIENKDTVVQNIEIQAQKEEDTASLPFSQSLKENGYLYTLKGLESPNGAINFKSINIFYKNKLHQKIIVDTVSVLNEREVVFSADKDANFDGYKDVELINWAGNYSYSSSFWLYNQKTGKYDHYKPLDTIQNIKIDAGRREITSNYHIGPANTYSKTYQWKNGKLLMMSAHIVEEGEEIQIYRKNGKIIVE